MPVSCNAVIAGMLVLFLEVNVKVIMRVIKPNLPILSTQWWHFPPPIRNHLPVLHFIRYIAVYYNAFLNGRQNESDHLSDPVDVFVQ